MLTHGIHPGFRGGGRLFKPPYAIGSVPSLSGHPQVRIDGVHCRESTGTEQEILKVIHGEMQDDIFTAQTSIGPYIIALTTGSRRREVGDGLACSRLPGTHQTTSGPRKYTWPTLIGTATPGTKWSATFLFEHKPRDSWASVVIFSVSAGRGKFQRFEPTSRDTSPYRRAALNEYEQRP